MSMKCEDGIDLNMRAPYIPMNESDDLPLLTEDLMWSAFSEELSLHKDIKAIHHNESSKESSLAALLSANGIQTHHSQQQDQNEATHHQLQQQEQHHEHQQQEQHHEHQHQQHHHHQNHQQIQEQLPQHHHLQQQQQQQQQLQQRQRNSQLEYKKNQSNKLDKCDGVIRCTDDELVEHMYNKNCKYI